MKIDWGGESGVLLRGRELTRYYKDKDGRGPRERGAGVDPTHIYIEIDLEQSWCNSCECEEVPACELDTLARFAVFRSKVCSCCCEKQSDLKRVGRLPYSVQLKEVGCFTVLLLQQFTSVCKCSAFPLPLAHLTGTARRLHFETQSHLSLEVIQPGSIV